MAWLKGFQFTALFGREALTGQGIKGSENYDLAF